MIICVPMTFLQYFIKYIYYKHILADMLVNWSWIDKFRGNCSVDRRHPRHYSVLFVKAQSSRNGIPKLYTPIVPLFFILHHDTSFLSHQSPAQNPCDPNPCQLNGVCTATPGSCTGFTCDCRSCSTGLTCETCKYPYRHSQFLLS